MDAFGDGVSDDELQLPRATLHKMINDALRAIDANQKISNECREMVCECGDEFVNAVSAEANEASTREGKSTITAEHVLRALRSAGVRVVRGRVRNRARRGQGGGKRKAGGEEEEEADRHERGGRDGAAE